MTKYQGINKKDIEMNVLCRTSLTITFKKQIKKEKQFKD